MSAADTHDVSAATAGEDRSSITSLGLCSNYVGCDGAWTGAAEGAILDSAFFHGLIVGAPQEVVPFWSTVTAG